MKVKEKPCKGTGNAKGYGCGKLTQHRIYGLGKMCCYADWLYNSPKGLEKVRKAALKVSKPRLEYETAKKERKDRNKITTLIESVKTVCHNYIKLRDKGKPCISCGAPYHSEHQAGHYYKAELYSSLKFNEWNINGQCVRCNIRLEGNLSQYVVNLPSRIGEDNFRVIEGMADVEKKLKWKWDRESLKSIREYYKQKIKELTKD